MSVSTVNSTPGLTRSNELRGPTVSDTGRAPRLATSARRRNKLRRARSRRQSAGAARKSYTGGQNGCGRARSNAGDLARRVVPLVGLEGGRNGTGVEVCGGAIGRSTETRLGSTGRLGRGLFGLLGAPGARCLARLGLTVRVATVASSPAARSSGTSDAATTATERCG